MLQYLYWEKRGTEVIMDCFLMCLVLSGTRPDCPAPTADRDGVSLKKTGKSCSGKRTTKGPRSTPDECWCGAAPPGFIDNNLTPSDTNSSFRGIRRKNSTRFEAGERRHVVKKSTALQGNASREQPDRHTGGRTYRAHDHRATRPLACCVCVWGGGGGVNHSLQSCLEPNRREAVHLNPAPSEPAEASPGPGQMDSAANRH